MALAVDLLYSIGEASLLFSHRVDGQTTIKTSLGPEFDRIDPSCH